MRHLFIALTIAVAGMTLASASHAKSGTDEPLAAPAHGAASAGNPDTKPGAGGGITGKVIETMDSGGYTYVQVDDGTKKVWAAAPKFTVAVGDQVIVPEGAPMPNFHSKTLGRDFDMVYFVGGVQVVGAKPAGDKPAGDQPSGDQVAAAHGGIAAAGTGAPLEFTNIKKADGGHTVAEIFAKKADLNGKDVKLRGKVAKFTPDVMGKNWIHVQDGTGSAGTNDLTVTTSGTAARGDTVLISGKLGTDKDFGFGYHYDVLIEDATVTTE